MRFDEDKYAQDYMKKLRRGARIGPDDLLERYAITLPASDQEITAQLKAVRIYWNKTSQGSSHTAQAAKMCRAEDERLKAEHGTVMEKEKWWKAREAERRSAAQASITSLADELKRSHGQVGVVTAGHVDRFAAKLKLSPADAAQAVKQAGLTLVEALPLPETEPIANFAALLKCMSECAARSVPDLVHPGAHPFKLLDRYVCESDRNKRLDLVAVEQQSAAADRRGVSSTDDAHRAALKILRTALKNGVDLRDVALYHLVTLAREYVPPSMTMAADQLRQAGLNQHDASVIAAVLFDQGSAGSPVGLEKVLSLLNAGQLNEARQAAMSLPTEFPGRDEAMQQTEAARKRLDALLSDVKTALAVPDEVRAATLLREAAAISSEEAESLLGAIPLAPSVALQAVCDQAVVKLFWKSAPGHDASTTYVVCRTEGRLPTAPGDGLLVYKGQAPECADSRAPVARSVRYGVFALADGRPSSRPAMTEVILLPPVTQLTADIGSAEVTVHWTTHPEAQAVRVVRRAEGSAPVPMPVVGNSCQVVGLTEGLTQYFEVTAIYRRIDGTELRSQAVQLKATPRAEAKPIKKLRARPVVSNGAVRVRVAWTPVDNSDVRIVRSDGPPKWQAGTRVSVEEMARSGQEVTGHRVTGRSEIAIEADLPPGVHHLVPFSIGGTGIVMGSPAAVGVTEPVRGVVATPFATYATISWEWPPTAQLAEVSWKVDGDTDCLVIGQAEYRSQGGARVPLGRGPCTVEVRAMIMADGVSFSSPPGQAVIDAVADVAISYSVTASASIGPIGGRSKWVAFRSDEGCEGVHVRMVALPGRVMPTRPDGGFVLLDTTLTLEPGTPVGHQVVVPRSVRRPYWMRCFVVGGGARLVDPPISRLKET
jgi:hypothetical protein